MPEIIIDDCQAVLKELAAEGKQFDAVITDPPYAISLHGMSWDTEDVAFSKNFWTDVFTVIRPGGFVVAFAASRLYHRLASVIEDVGFKLYPSLAWQFDNGLPKPVNVSELFDRDNIKDRKSVGVAASSGFTTANATHGAQQRLTKEFVRYERGVSEEAKDWLGYYYGVNCMRPTQEPIVLAQKPPSEKRMIDNLRLHGVGALNLDALKERHGEWPGTVLKHKKARKDEHGSSHPSVKPLSLMEDLCLLACPAGGHILEPFGGTGTTAAAAAKHGFDYTIIEQNPEMEEVIHRRIQNAVGIEMEPLPFESDSEFFKF